MKKRILSIIALAFATYANAQSGIVIQEDGAGSPVNGQIVNFTVDPFTYNSSDPFTFAPGPHLYVTNQTGSDQQWQIERYMLSVPTGWQDQICWPPTCFPYNSNTYYTTPNTGGNPAPIIANGTHMTTTNALAEIKPNYKPEYSTYGSAHYRYYVVTTTGTRLDSVDVVVSYPLSVKEASTIELSMSPNPASDVVNITAENASGATLKVIDVLGNVVAVRSFNGKETLRVAEYKSGVYFIRIESPGYKAITKKLVVRH